MLYCFISKILQTVFIFKIWYQIYLSKIQQDLLTLLLHIHSTIEQSIELIPYFSPMFHDFIKKKINVFMDRFVENSDSEIHINKWEGTIQKSNIRLNQSVAKHLSSLFGMPVKLVSGTIGTLLIHIPWTSIFKDQTKLVIEDLQLIFETTEEFDLSFYQNARRQFVESYLRKHIVSNQHDLFEIEQKKKIYLKSLKDFLLNRLRLEVNSLHIAIRNRVGKSFQLGTTCKSISFKNFVKGDQHKFVFQVQELGLYLDPIGHGRQNEQKLTLKSRTQTIKNIANYIIIPANCSISTIKKEDKRTKVKETQLHIRDRLTINISNKVTNYIKILLGIRSWHNCFSRTVAARPPYTIRPTQSPERWWRYLKTLIYDQIKSSKLRNKHAHLPYRRQYINMYLKYARARQIISQFGPQNQTCSLSAYSKLIHLTDLLPEFQKYQMAQSLKKMEKALEIYEIAEYRKYAQCLLATQKHKKQTFLQVKATQKLKENQRWFRAFFKQTDSKTQMVPELAELDIIVQEAHTSQNSISLTHIQIDELEVNTVILIAEHSDPFLQGSLKGLKYSIDKNEQKGVKKSQLFIDEIVIDYHEYLNHPQRYQSLFARKNMDRNQGVALHDQEESFQQYRQPIVKMLATYSKVENTTQISLKVEPFIFVFNDETLKKIKLFTENRKLSKTTNSYIEETSNNIFQMLIKKIGLHRNTKVQLQMYGEILIPESLYQATSNQIILRVQEIDLDLKSVVNTQAQLRLDLRHLYLFIGSEQGMEPMMNNINLEICLSAVPIADQLIIAIQAQIRLSEVIITLSSRIINLILGVLAPKDGIKTPDTNNEERRRFSMVESMVSDLRTRKKSIGQEFIHAVENYTDYLNVSVTDRRKMLTSSLARISQPKINRMLEFFSFKAKISCPILQLSHQNNKESETAICNSISLNNFQAAISKEQNCVKSLVSIAKISIQARSFDELKRLVLKISKVLNTKTRQAHRSSRIGSIASKAQSILSRRLPELDFVPSQINIKLPLIRTSLGNIHQVLLEAELSANLDINFNLRNNIKISGLYSLQVHIPNGIHTLQILQIVLIQSSLQKNTNYTEINLQINPLNINLNRTIIENIHLVIKDATNFQKLMRKCTYINKLNVPIYIHNSVNSFTKIIPGEQWRSSKSQNIGQGQPRYKDIIVNDVKHSFDLSKSDESLVVGTTLLYCKTTNTMTKGWTITFQSNLEFINDTSKNIHLKIHQNQQQVNKFVSVSLIKPQEALFVLARQLHLLSFSIEIQHQQYGRLIKFQELTQNIEVPIQCGTSYAVLQKEKTAKKHSIHICCPLEVTNLLPKEVSLKFNKELTDHQDAVFNPVRKTRLIRRKSVQMISLDKAMPGQCFSLTSIPLCDIDEIYIQFQGYYKIFKVGISEVKPKSETIKIVTLMHPEGKFLNIQLRLVRKEHTLKLILTSQYMFVNLVDHPVKIRVKEEQYFHEQIQVANTVVGQIIEHMNEVSENREQLAEFYQRCFDEIQLFSGREGYSDQLFYLNDNNEGYSIGNSKAIQIKLSQDKYSQAILRCVNTRWNFSILLIYPVCQVVNQSSINLVFISDQNKKQVPSYSKTWISTYKHSPLKIITHNSDHVFFLNIDILGKVYMRVPYEEGYLYLQFLVCRSEAETTVIIEQSLDAPFTFINKTNHTLCLRQGKHRSQLIMPSSQTTYSLLDPYHTVSLALQCSYSKVFYELCRLEVPPEQRILELNNHHTGIKMVISIYSFKQKYIFLISDIKQDLRRFIEQSTSSHRLKATIKSLGISVFTSSCREICRLQYKKILLAAKLSPKTTSISAQVSNCKFYNFSAIEPHQNLSVDFSKRSYHLLSQLKHRMDSLVNKNSQEEQEAKSLFSVYVSYYFDQNVKFVKELNIDMEPVAFNIDIRLIIDLIQNLAGVLDGFQQFSTQMHAKNSSRKKTIANSSYSMSCFVIQKLRISQWLLELVVDNIQTLEQLYYGNTTETLLIAFLKNNAKRFPINLNQFVLQYERLTLHGLLKCFRLEQKIRELISEVVFQPAKQLHNGFLALFGVGSSGGGLEAMSKVFELGKTILSCIWRKNQSSLLATSTLYDRILAMTHWKNPVQPKWKKSGLIASFVDKPHHFSFRGQTDRYERYSRSTKSIEPYVHEQSIVKLCLNIYYKGKRSRQILRIWKLSGTCLLAIDSNHRMLLVQTTLKTCRIFDPANLLRMKVDKQTDILTLEIYEDCRRSSEGFMHYSKELSEIHVEKTILSQQDIVMIQSYKNNLEPLFVLV